MVDNGFCEAATSCDFLFRGDDVNPELCTELMGVRPWRAWRKGELYVSPRVPMPHVRSSGLWLYGCEKCRWGCPPCESLEKRISFLETRRAALLQCHEHGRICASVGLEVEARDVVFTIPTSFFKRLLDLRIDQLTVTFLGYGDVFKDVPEFVIGMMKSGGNGNVSVWRNGRLSSEGALFSLNSDKIGVGPDALVDDLLSMGRSRIDRNAGQDAGLILSLGWGIAHGTAWITHQQMEEILELGVSGLEFGFVNAAISDDCGG